LPANVTICSLHLFRNCFLPSITSGMWVKNIAEPVVLQIPEAL